MTNEFKRSKKDIEFSKKEEKRIMAENVVMMRSDYAKAGQIFMD
jgi:uncharacterized protein YqgQ